MNAVAAVLHTRAVVVAETHACQIETAELKLAHLHVAVVALQHAIKRGELHARKAELAKRPPVEEEEEETTERKIETVQLGVVVTQEKVLALLHPFWCEQVRIRAEVLRQRAQRLLQAEQALGEALDRLVQENAEEKAEATKRRRVWVEQ